MWHWSGEQSHINAQIRHSDEVIKHNRVNLCRHRYLSRCRHCQHDKVLKALHCWKVWSIDKQPFVITTTTSSTNRHSITSRTIRNRLHSNFMMSCVRWWRESELRQRHMSCHMCGEGIGDDQCCFHHGKWIHLICALVPGHTNWIHTVVVCTFTFALCLLRDSFISPSLSNESFTVKTFSQFSGSQ